LETLIWHFKPYYNGADITQVLNSMV